MGFDTAADYVPTAALPARPDLRKRWLLILPAVFVTYSLAYVDRTNYGMGAAAGLAETLHITPSQNALLGALFFFGYFLLQMPGTAYARRHSVRTLIAISMVAWGILAALTGVVRSFWLLALVRTLLGVAESFVLPGMLILLTRWFTRPERSRTNTFLILGNPVTVMWMSAVTGYIIKAFGWQMTFILEGLPPVLWGALWYMVIRDRPEDAAWLSEESRADLHRVLEQEQSHIPKVAGLGAALRNPNVILLCANYFLWSVGVYGFVLWLPVIIRQGSSAGIGLTGLLSAIPYAFAVIFMLVVSHFSDRAARRAKFVWPFLIVSGLAFLGSYLTSATSFSTAFLFLILAGATMYAPYGPFFAIIPEMLPSNVAGEVTALVNSCGALGSFVGSYVVGYLQGATGSSRAGFLFMSAALTLSGVLILLLRPASTTSPEPTPDALYAE